MARSVRASRVLTKEDVAKIQSSRDPNRLDFIDDLVQRIRISDKADATGRIMPPTWDLDELPGNDTSHFALKISVHYDLGPHRSSVLCSRLTLGEPCAVCDAKDRMVDAGVTDEKILSSFTPRERYVMFFVNTTTPEERAKGIQVFDYPPKLNRFLIQSCYDPNTGEYYVPDSLDEGLAVTIGRKGMDQTTEWYCSSGKKLTSFDITPEEEAFLEEHPLTERLVRLPYERVKAEIEKGLPALSESTPTQSGPAVTFDLPELTYADVMALEGSHVDDLAVQIQQELGVTNLGAANFSTVDAQKQGICAAIGLEAPAAPAPVQRVARATQQEVPRVAAVQKEPELPPEEIDDVPEAAPPKTVSVQDRLAALRAKQAQA